MFCVRQRSSIEVKVHLFLRNQYVDIIATRFICALPQFLKGYSRPFCDETEHLRCGLLIRSAVCIPKIVSQVHDVAAIDLTDRCRGDYLKEETKLLGVFFSVWTMPLAILSTLIPFRVLLR